MLIPPSNDYAHALVNVICLTDALTTSHAIVGAKKERLQAFRTDAAQVLMMVIGIELPVGQLAEVQEG